MNNLEKQEKLVDQYVEQGKKDAAIQLLYQLIVKLAKQKNFAKAELLREKLFEVDSMALTEIIRTAEIIEEEKSETVDGNHMVIWSDLYESLTTEEANILYFAMKKKEFYSDEPVFRQGQKNENLWFPDQGQLKLIFRQKDVEKLIQKIKPGMVAGADTFFSITVCTTSLVALGRVKANYIDKNTYQEWEKDQPALASKLKDFCAKQDKDTQLLRKKGINRREHRRIRVSGLIMFQVLNAKGNPIGKAFKGELSDLSVGGLSFFITTANSKNALMLLGRKLNVKFNLQLGKGNLDTAQSGTITGVINHMFNEYSIHMSFEKMLSKLVIEEMALLPESQKKKKRIKADKSLH